MRISFKSYCAKCFTDFPVGHLNQYLPIDNDSFCLSCRKEIDPKDRSEWIPSLFLGRNYEEGRKNLLKIIESWNEELDQDQWSDYSLRIEVERSK